MNLKGLFKKKVHFFGLDIGSSSIKCVELNLSGHKPKLVRAISAPLRSEVFSSYSIQQGEKVGEIISEMIAEYDLEEKRASIAVPGPSVFTKRIKLPKVSLDELADNIQLEAGNFIPHNIQAVHLDFHVFGETGKNMLDVLIVAVKNEVIESFVDAAGLGGVTVGIADVDFFAVQNVFEMNYPDLADKNIALVNVGSRYSSVNICKNEQTLFTGDIAIGGKQFTEAISESLGISFDEAEKIKLQGAKGNAAAEQALATAVETACAEFNRQLSFFWSATGLDEAIDGIFLSGGGSLVPGLKEKLEEKTGIDCLPLNPILAVDCSDVKFSNPPEQFAVAIGLALREYGDKVIPNIG